MDWFNNLVDQNPYLAIIAMLVVILGGIMQIAIPAARRWGFWGDKTPTNGELMDQLKLISDNHLSGLPDSEKAIIRMESKLDAIGDTLKRIEAKL
jgi:hypothetical protein